MKEIEGTKEANELIPELAVLETWSRRTWTDGVQIDELNELDSYVVETAHHIYELTVMNPRIGEVLIQGGTFFPKRTTAYVVGASMGGSSFLKVRGIQVGLKIELQFQNRRIITSSVRKISMIGSAMRHRRLSDTQRKSESVVSDSR